MIKRAIKNINEAQNILVFTGAGISTNSGILDFRSSDGLYRMIDENYDLLYPEAIFDLEQASKVSLVVTQNSDMLHQRAGSINILECHGTFSTAHCLECENEYDYSEYEPIIMDGVVPHCTCGGLIKPDVVFFGEEIPAEFYALLNNPPYADLLLILGTSLNVQPTSKFAIEIADKIPSIFVNLEPTQYDSDMSIEINEDLDDFAEAVMDNLIYS